MKNKKAKQLAVLLIIFSSLLLFLNLGGSKDLVASLAQLPGLADSPEKGAFVDLVKAIDDVYTEGRIKIEVYPFPRSINNIMTNKADFHIPMFKNPIVSESKLPYNYCTERMGTVSLVIYSHRDKPITKKMIRRALDRGGKFPYVIESASGLEAHYEFPISKAIANIDLSLKKLAKKRIDALVWAQEEADLTLRKLKMKTIYRSHYTDFDDIILIPKGPEGKTTDKILSKALKKLRKSGKLKKLYFEIHHPYDDWQPSKMGW